METPSFTFRLARVRDLRERAEEHAVTGPSALPAGTPYAAEYRAAGASSAARPASALSASPSVHGNV